MERTAELLLSIDDPNELTTRRIAENAGINPAMVNYYFGSKDELLKRVIRGSEKHIAVQYAENTRKAMFDELLSIYETTISYSKYGLTGNASDIAKNVARYSESLSTMVEKYHGGVVNREQCRSAAHQLVSSIMMASLDPITFTDYSKIDIQNKNSMKSMISHQLDTLLGSSL